MAAAPSTALVVVLVYTLTIAALGLRYHVMGDGDAEADFFGAYVVQARAFLDGHVIIDAFRGPIYPMVLAIAGRALSVFGAGLFETGIVLSALAAGGALLLIRRFLEPILGGAPALAAMLLVACNPVFVRYSYTAGTDMFFVLLAMAAVTAALRVPAFSWRRPFFAAVLLALAYLTRYNAVALLAGVCLAVVPVNAWSLSWRRRLAAAAALLALFAVLITPWGLYRLAEKGSFFYSENHMNVLYSLLPEGSDTGRIFGADLSRYHSVFDVIAAAPGLFLGQLPERIARELAPGMLLPWVLAAAAVPGLASLLARRPSRQEASWYLVALCVFATMLLVFYNPRFGLFLVPVYATLAVRWIRALPSRWSGRVAVKGAAVAVVIVTITGSAVPAVTYNRATIRGGDPRVREMGEWFRATVPAHMRGERVAARKPAFSYFAGLEPVPLPVLETHAELMTYLQEQDADYLFFSYIALATRPGLAYLAESVERHPGLEPVRVTPVAILYRVVLRR